MGVLVYSLTQPEEVVMFLLLLDMPARYIIACALEELPQFNPKVYSKPMKDVSRYRDTRMKCIPRNTRLKPGTVHPRTLQWIRRRGY